MDFDPSVFDVRLSSGWSTILVGGNRDGAGNFFALDVSDPERPELLRVQQLVLEAPVLLLRSTRLGFLSNRIRGNQSSDVPWCSWAYVHRRRGF